MKGYIPYHIKHIIIGYDIYCDDIQKNILWTNSVQFNKIDHCPTSQSFALKNKYPTKLKFQLNGLLTRAIWIRNLIHHIYIALHIHLCLGGHSYCNLSRLL